MIRGRIAFLVFIAVGICRATAPVAEISPAGSPRPPPALSATGRIRGDEQTSAPKSPVDQLIPWLLDEDRQLREIPFSEVIVDVTGKKVLAFDTRNETDQRVAKEISAACDTAMKHLNASDSPIQNIQRINEVSSRFEDL